MGYVSNTPENQQAMLAQIGVSSVADLFQQVPAAVRLNRPLRVPEALSEMELTGTVQQLAAKNRKLAVRAKFFDALSGFQGELRPDAAPQVVLHAIAQRQQWR